MKNSSGAKSKEVFVTLILTESTSSLLNENVPYLDETHPANSRVCIITERELKKTLNKRKQAPKDGTFIDFGNNTILINSEVALFSTRNRFSFSDDLTDSDNSVRDSGIPASKELFRKTDIVFYPLVAARSKAHDNKLNYDRNNLCVGLLDSASQLSLDHICRICHGGDSTGDLLTPCRCRGSIALVHLKCLERWLRESNNSTCELCQHRFKIIREPKYSIPWSILEFLKYPGVHLKEIVLDLIALIAYTPTAVTSTYLLMLICESLYTNSLVTSGPLSSHILMLFAVLGMITIDVTYSSWLISTFKKHMNAWKAWYKTNSQIKVILPKMKTKPHHKRSRRID